MLSKKPRKPFNSLYRVQKKPAPEEAGATSFQFPLQGSSTRQGHEINCDTLSIPFIGFKEDEKDDGDLLIYLSIPFIGFVGKYAVVGLRAKSFQFPLQGSKLCIGGDGCEILSFNSLYRVRHCKRRQQHSNRNLSIPFIGFDWGDVVEIEAAIIPFQFPLQGSANR